MGQHARLQSHQWHGVYTADFTLDGVRRRCANFIETLIDRRWSCLVAYDTRFMAGQFALDLYRAMEARGINVSLCAAPAPFPAVDLALEQRRADCALIVSAGNRPLWYNGLIVLAPPVDQRFLEPGPPLQPENAPFPPAEGPINSQIDLRMPYLERMREVVDTELIRRSGLTLFVDPMNGTTSGYIPATLAEGGQTKAIEINRELDPLFGRQTPNPAESGLNRLRKLVKESDSHFGVAISADGRALGVADHQGELVSPLTLTLLLAQYLARQHRQRGLVIAPQPSALGDMAAVLKDCEDSFGLKVELAADPTTRIAETLGRDRSGLLIGATATGEFSIGRYGDAPDAILAALLLAELAARGGRKLRALIDEMKGKP